MDTRRTVAIVLGIAVLFGIGFAVLATKSFEAVRTREVPLDPVVLSVSGDLGPVISSRAIEPVPGGPVDRSGISAVRPLGASAPPSSPTTPSAPSVRLPRSPPPPPPRPTPPALPPAPPAARAPDACIVELRIPPAFVGTGRTDDTFATAAAARSGALHLGVGAVGNVWNTPFTFTPSLTDALGLAWAGLRYGMNPNALAALAIKESRYDCARYSDGCFQIEQPTFTELQRQFPRTLGAAPFAATVQHRALAPSVAALLFQFDEHLFRRWYPWDAFLGRARDGSAHLKLLARAYNRGAWDQNLGNILTRDGDRCATAPDLLTCFDDHAIARDHAASIASVAARLTSLPAYDRAITWNEFAAFLEAGVKPLAGGADWPRFLTIARTGYDCLATTAHRFTYRFELPRLLTWLSDALGVIEAPQAAGEYRAPVSAGSSAAPTASAAPSGGAASAFQDDFNRDLAAWATAFTGYGVVELVGGALRLSPQAAASIGETHAAFVTIRGLDRDMFTMRLRTRTVAQLRTGSPANPWEVGWVLFHYRDLADYYYLIVKPNGVELGKKQGSDAQVFLETHDTPRLTIGAWMPLTITSELLANGSRRIRATAGGVPAVDFTDSNPLHGGTIALYTEDADVRFDDIVVE